jgi:Exoribonuclease R
VKLDETGADGLLPMRALGREYFHYDADSQTLMGADTGLTIGIGDRVVVKLAEAVPVTGGLTLELVEIDGKRPPKRSGPPRRGGASRGRGKPAKPRRKLKKTARAR